LGLVLGEGLLTNRDHESWFTRRRMLQPVFHRRCVAAMADEMVAAGQKMLSLGGTVRPRGCIGYPRGDDAGYARRYKLNHVRGRRDPGS
jgi:hypothetical protein